MTNRNINMTSGKQKDKKKVSFKKIKFLFIDSSLLIN
jgi:hypothetical protein